MKAERGVWRWNTDMTYLTNGVDEILIVPATREGQAVLELHDRLTGRARPKKRRWTSLLQKLFQKGKEKAAQS